MAIHSKYSNQQVEQVINELLAVLVKHNATVDLSLMCLGNVTSHLISENVPASQQQQIIASFSQALKAATSND